MTFHNRNRELASLSRVLPESGSHMLILYGRRRVGKTELLRHFYSDRPHVFYMADQTSSALHIRDLSGRIGRFWQDRYLSSAPAMSWGDLLQYLAQRGEPLDLILDEFPYLCEAEPALPSLLQRFWDESAAAMGIRLTLCGSSVSFMEREILSERSPLFGRRSAQMLLRPLNFWECSDFLPGYSPRERVEVFGCLGGMPAYLALINPDQPLSYNLLTQALDPVAYLYDEPRLLLQQELREPRVYFAVLRALAAGRTRHNDIAQECQLQANTVGRYLDLLIRLHCVERFVPATEEPTNSRKGIYRIVDPFMRFWFRFIQPNLSELELGRGEEVLNEEILPHLPHFLAPTFEELCREWIRLQPGLLPFRPKKVGAWWDRAHEVDILAFNHEHVFFGECKWSERPVTAAAFQQLVSNASAVPGFEGHTKHYGLFAKAGFQERLPGCHCFDLEDIVAE